MSSTLDNLRKRLRTGTPPLEGVPIHYPNLVSITAGELREVCKQNPQHPLSGDKLASVSMYADNREVFCEYADIQAILDDGDSVFEVKVENGRRVSTKKFVPKSSTGPIPVINEPDPE